MNNNRVEYTAKNGLKITLRLEEEKDYSHRFTNSYDFSPSQRCPPVNI